MLESIYRIETFDGQVIMKKAKRAYRFGWVGRTIDSKVVKGSHSELTTKPGKYALGETFQNQCKEVYQWKYERLYPIKIQ